MRERRDEYPQTTSTVCGGRTPGKNCAINPQDDVVDDDRWGHSGHGSTRRVGPMPVDNMAVFKAEEVSMETSRFHFFGVETVPCVTAANKVGKCHRGIIKAADGFMARGQRAEAENKLYSQNANEKAKNMVWGWQSY